MNSTDLKFPAVTLLNRTPEARYLQGPCHSSFQTEYQVQLNIPLDLPMFSNDFFFSSDIPDNLMLLFYGMNCILRFLLSPFGLLLLLAFSRSSIRGWLGIELKRIRKKRMAKEAAGKAMGFQGVCCFFSPFLPLE